MSWKNKEFAESYNEFYPLVLSTLYTKVGNMDDARDICQDIFLAFYNNFETIENKRKWLYGTIKNSVMNFYRKKKANIDIDEIFNDAGMTFVNGFRDIRIILNDVIENEDNFEKPYDRTLFELIAIDRFTYEKVGKQLGLSKRQIRYQYSKIVAKIVHNLNQKGINKLEDLL